MIDCISNITARPRLKPPKSIITSVTRGPRPGAKHWIVSSIQAVHKPGRYASTGFLLPISKYQHQSAPRPANSSTCAILRRSPVPVAGVASPLGINSSSNFLTALLSAAETSAGSMELPQINATLAMIRATHSLTRFFVLTIATNADAPTKSSCPAGSGRYRLPSVPSSHTCSQQHYRSSRLRYTGRR